MIMENLIANYERDEEDDFGFQNLNLLEVKDKIKIFSKMPSHEPTTTWSSNKRENHLMNQEQNGRGANHPLKKTLTQTSIDSKQYVKGNFVFTKMGLQSTHTTPSKHDKDQQKMTFISPIFSLETTVKKQKNEQREQYQEERQEDSTNEKIQEHQSSGESLSPYSNQAVMSKRDQSLAKHVQQFQYEKAESNKAEVRSSDNSINDAGLQKVFLKSRFSRKQVSESVFKKNTSFSDKKLEQNQSNDEKISPSSLREIKIPIQKVAPQQLNVDIYRTRPQTNGSLLNFNQSVDETNRFKDFDFKKKSQTQSQDQRMPNIPLSSVEKFKIVGTVARTLSRLQVSQVSRIESSEQLDREIDQMKQLRQNSSFFQENNKINIEKEKVRQENKHDTVNIAFNMLRSIEIITDLAERGHPEDLDHIINILQKDPKKYLRANDDPSHLLNKLNSKNQNCIYVACKNGNLNIVQFLVKQEINLNIKSKIGGKIDDYPLQVAVRWNHKDVVEFILNQRVVKVNQEQIKLSYKEAKTKDIKQQLFKHLKNKPFFICC